jgi:hypothetical protein
MLHLNTGKKGLSSGVVRVLAAANTHSKSDSTTRHLRALTIRGKCLKDEGVAKIAAWLKEETVLTRLTLENASFGDAGLVSLAEALMTNTSVTSVEVTDGYNSYMEKFDAGAALLGGVLRTNTSLTSLPLRFIAPTVATGACNTPGALMDACRHIGRNRALLYVSRQLSNAAAAAGYLSSLTRIAVARCMLGDEGLGLLRDALQGLQGLGGAPLANLVSLDVRANLIRSRGVQRVCGALARPGCKIQELLLGEGEEEQRVCARAAQKVLGKFELWQRVSMWIVFRLY